MAEGMAITQLGLGAVSMVSQFQQADMIKRQGEFDAYQMEMEAKLSEFEKNDIQQQTDKAIEQRNNLTSQVLGEQNVAIAGQGVRVGDEMSVIAEQAERDISTEDIMAMRNNSWRQIMGIEIRQDDLMNSARFARMNGSHQASLTRLNAIASMGQSTVNAASTYKNLGGKSSFWDTTSTSNSPKMSSTGYGVNYDFYKPIP